MNDERPQHVKREMAQFFAEHEADYREGEDWCNIVYEDDEVVLIEDEIGNEISEWVDEYPEIDLYQIMHDLADQLVDRRWPTTYPVVFDKLED